MYRTAVQGDEDQVTLFLKLVNTSDSGLSAFRWSLEENPNLSPLYAVS